MSGLSWLLEPQGEDDFMREIWANRFESWRSTTPLLSRLQSVLNWENLGPFLERCEPVSVWFRSRQGDLQSIRVSAKDSIALSQAGMTVYGDIMPHKFPELGDVFEQGWEAAERLGVGQKSFRLGFFASRKGSHTPLHFDSGDGFTLQLSGTKRWRLAANTHLPLPDNNFLARGSLPASLHAVGGGPMPAEFPEPSREVTMQPGVMLYVPRGTWHCTDTDEDSLSLDFNFTPRLLWKDVLRDTVERLLLPLEDARQPFVLRENSGPLIDSLLDRLRADLQGLDARAFLPPSPTRPAGRPLRWNPLMSMFIERKEEGRLVVSFRSSNPEVPSVEMKFSEALMAVVQRFRRGESLQDEEVSRMGLSAAHARKLLDTLWTESILIGAA